MTNAKTSLAFMRCLDISSRHIPRFDADKLDICAQRHAETKWLGEPEGGPLIVCAKGGFGWWLCVPDQQDDLAESSHSALAFGYSQAVVDLMHLAFKHDCQWIALDRDGTEYAHLSTFEW